MKFVNPFGLAGKWYKANLHTHTTTSDGQATPAQQVENYRNAGYGVLALTDHHKTNDVRPLTCKRMLVLSGMEYHPACPAHPGCHHLVALNLPHPFAFDAAIVDDANTCIQAVRQAGGESFLCHPYWCGHRYDHYSYLKDIVGVEVYNSTCDKVARSAGDVDWSHLLDAGRMLTGLAVDDCHGDVDLFGGWTWLRLKSLTPAAVVQAVKTGAFYSSTGPEIRDFRVENGMVHVECSPVEFIYIAAHEWHGNRRKAEPGKAIRKFETPVPKETPYVRAIVVGHTGRRAWTNPILL